MASTQCYSDSEELNDYQNTRGFMKPSTDQRYQYRKSTSLTEKVKAIAHSARNKLHRHHESDVPLAEPVASHPHSAPQVPNKGQPVASHPQSGPQVPINKGHPVATPNGSSQVPNKGQPLWHRQDALQVIPNKGQPVAGHTQNGLQVPNKAQPVVGQTQKPELDLFHVDSYNQANLGKNKGEGFVFPQQNVHAQKTKQENFDSETETESDDSDDETPLTKAPPVASHAQKPTITTFNMASNINANTVMKKDQAPVLPKETVQEQKKVVYYYSETETETESDSDDEASKKKN